MPNRMVDKKDVLHLQTDRIFQSDNEWFICTREGIGVGPYATKELATARGKELALRLTNLEDQDEILAAIRNFVFQTSGLTEEQHPSLQSG